MIKVTIPNNNLPERKYAVKVLLEGFLGIDISFTVDDTQIDYLIDDGLSTIIIRDHFFSKNIIPHSYLKDSFIPSQTSFVKNGLILEEDIPVIFGSDEMHISENEIICGIDIFASSFFMLTRWEEYVNLNRDIHNRFPGICSVAYKCGFLHRPVVNEYVELLWAMLKKVGYKGERKNKNFELFVSHDVDALTYVSWRSLLGDLIKRGNAKKAWSNLGYLVNKDPFDTYDFLMNLSETNGIKSHFYFMSTDSMLKYDTSNYLRRRKFHSVVRRIKERDHIIGFHPGYYTYDDPDRWYYEKKRLEDSIGQSVHEGRQHFLRIDITKTFPIWEKNHMEIDNTMGYADKEGFRCGTGDLFPIFDILQRKQLALQERPLIIMDGTLRQYQNYSPEEVYEVIHQYITIGIRYKSIISILFHNSSFYGDWTGYDFIYKQILSG